MLDVIGFVAPGLRDLSVSRPVERLTWGIPVPGDETQTIYVWLDALVNYLTKAGYPFPPGQESKLGWPADVHVIGKDIVRYVDLVYTLVNSALTALSFHCIYWPAFLMALDLPVPRNVLVHGHWTMNHEKMSKSTGNVVNPFYAIDRFSADALRFFLLYQGPRTDDADYDNKLIYRNYTKLLQKGTGNFIFRVFGFAKWNLKPIIETAASGTLPAPSSQDEIFESFLKSASLRVESHMEKLDPTEALRKTMEILDKV